MNSCEKWEVVAVVDDDIKRKCVIKQSNGRDLDVQEKDAYACMVN